jgi:glycosyltransferase involved in cell wall biosynthesis
MGLRIGIMLRHLDQHNGGVVVYTNELLDAMLAAESIHEYVFLYQNPALVGTYAGNPRITEVVLASRSRLWWDQIAVPKAVRKYGIDVLFNPKFSMALAASCPTSWVCHGQDWYIEPEWSRFRDRLSHRFLVPQYARKADTVIAVSETTRQHVIKYQRLPPERVRTVYSGVAKLFSDPVAASKQEELRQRLNLPERFVLYVGAVYPSKNFTRLVEAYAKVGPKRDVGLVIAGGENRFLSEHELDAPERLGLQQWLRRPGWLEQKDLAILYSMADGLLMPSLYEACPLPLIEAMAAGCPILTSNCHGSAEIAGAAAIQVDPYDIDAIAADLERLLDDEALRKRLIMAGRERATSFSWARCATETLDALQAIAGYRPVESGQLSVSMMRQPALQTRSAGTIPRQSRRRSPR